MRLLLLLLSLCGVYCTLNNFNLLPHLTTQTVPRLWLKFDRNYTINTVVTLDLNFSPNEGIRSWVNNTIIDYPCHVLERHKQIVCPSITLSKFCFLDNSRMTSDNILFIGYVDFP